MQPHEPFNTDVQASRANHLMTRPYRHVPPLALMVTSVFVLSGCEAVKAIFKTGAWFGALVVITIVAIIAAVTAMVVRK